MEDVQSSGKKGKGKRKAKKRTSNEAGWAGAGPGQPSGSAAASASGEPQLKKRRTNGEKGKEASVDIEVQQAEGGAGTARPAPAVIELGSSPGSGGHTREDDAIIISSSPCRPRSGREMGRSGGARPGACRHSPFSQPHTSMLARRTASSFGEIQGPDLPVVDLTVESEVPRGGPEVIDVEQWAAENPRAMNAWRDLDSDEEEDYDYAPGMRMPYPHPAYRLMHARHMRQYLSVLHEVIRQQPDLMPHGGMSYEALLALDGPPTARMNPASSRQISKHPIRKLRKAEHNEKCCCICLDDMEAGTRVRTLPCDHYFHVKWLKVNKVCPVDKQPIDTPEKAAGAT